MSDKAWVILVHCEPLPSLSSQPYSTREEAEAAAMAAVLKKPVLLGRVEVVDESEAVAKSKGLGDKKPIQSDMDFITSRYTMFLEYGGVTGIASVTLAEGPPENK